MIEIIDVKKIIHKNDVSILLSPSVYNPTAERLLNRAKKYQANDKIQVYAFSENGKYKGIVAFEICGKTAEILDIAVKPECQGKGIGSKLIDFIFSRFEISKVLAETDDEAVGFYKEYGFVVADTKIEFNTKRYTVIKE